MVDDEENVEPWVIKFLEKMKKDNEEKEEDAIQEQKATRLSIRKQTIGSEEVREGLFDDPEAEEEDY
tara:strand:+ start:21463 stop:21663 length:201 start_codon:yes stop_codon:yes gene_type:complete